MSPSLSGRRYENRDLSEKVRKEVTARLVTDQVTAEAGASTRLVSTGVSIETQERNLGRLGPPQKRNLISAASATSCPKGCPRL